MATLLFGKGINLDNIIEIRNLTFKYGSGENKDEPALKNINLDIKKGEFLVLLGHNGSGKSTLAKMLNGLLKPDEGQVLVNGIDTKDEKEEINIKQTVGMVFQNPDNQIIATIVEEDVAFGPENLGFAPEETKRRVDEALRAVDMLDYRDFPPHKLSGGQKQRIAIAGVIAMEPECIVLDESTAMLDPRGRREVMDTVLKLNKQKGMTVVLITHFMEESEKADRVAIMENGAIFKVDTPRKIFLDEQTIKHAGLSLPQSSALLHKLKKDGFDIATDALGEEECVEVLKGLLKGGVLK